MRLKEHMKPITADKAFPKFKGRTILEEFDLGSREPL